MRKAILICATVLACSLPAAAQDGFASTSTAATLVSTAFVNWDAPQIPTTRHFPERVAERANPVIHANPAPLKKSKMELSAGIREPEARSSVIMSMYDFTETPFVQNVKVPMASLAGGRIEFGGYLQMTSEENFEMGLPGSGTLPAWGIGMQNHPAVLAPRADSSAGFNISFCIHGTGFRETHFHAAAAFGRAIAFVRGI